MSSCQSATSCIHGTVFFAIHETKIGYFNFSFQLFINFSTHIRYFVIVFSSLFLLRKSSNRCITDAWCIVTLHEKIMSLGKGEAVLNLFDMKALVILNGHSIMTLSENGYKSSKIMSLGKGEAVLNLFDMKALVILNGHSIMTLSENGYKSSMKMSIFTLPYMYIDSVVYLVSIYYQNLIDHNSIWKPLTTLESAISVFIVGTGLLWQ